MQAGGVSNMERVVSSADTVRRRRLMAVATVALLVALVAVAEVNLPACQCLDALCVVVHVSFQMDLVA